MDKVTKFENPSEGKTKKRRLNLGQGDPRALFFLSSAIVLLSYVKPLFSVWAYSDEYDFFEIIPKLGKHMARDGNLISSVVYDYFSAPLINSPGDLWKLRVLSFLCLFLILNDISKRILLHNRSRTLQFLLPIALTLPAPMTFISWALIWQGSFAMVIAYLATVFWLKSKGSLKLISVILMWTSILMSPVAAFSILGFYASVFILARLKSVDFIKEASKLVTLYGISGMFSLLTIFVSKTFFGSTLNERVGPPQLNDLPEKLNWIISRPIIISMRFFDISSPTQMNAIFVTLIVSSLLMFGFFYQSKKLNENVYLRLALFTVLILLSITPIAVTWSNQIEFRYIMGPSVSIFLVTVWLTVETFSTRRNLLRHASVPFVLITLFLGITTMNWHVDKQFITPYKSKISFIQSELSSCLNVNPSLEEIIVLQPRKSFPVRNNIGMFSQSTDLASPWVPIPTVMYVSRAFGMFPKDVILIDFLVKGDPKYCVVDLEKYRQSLVALDRPQP